MTRSSRDRIGVDLRGLKAVLVEQARARGGVSPSELVRDALVEVVGQSDLSSIDRLARAVVPTEGRVRLSLRMSREEASAILATARNAGLAPGAFVSGLAANVPALAIGASRTDYLATLVASSAELSTLSRNIHHLTSLLRQGNVRPALEYRAMLDALAGDVRGHLTIAARVLADLQPQRRSGLPSKRPTS